MRLDFSRSGRSIPNLFQLISRACQPWPDARFRITVTGTADRDMGFARKDPVPLCQAAMKRAGWPDDRCELVIGEGTGNEIVIEILGIDW